MQPFLRVPKYSWILMNGSHMFKKSIFFTTTPQNHWIAQGHALVWPCWCVGWNNTVIISWLVSNVHFNCIIQYSLYHNRDIGTMWHCALVSCTPYHRLWDCFGVCVFLVLSVIMCSFYYIRHIILIHHEFHHEQLFVTIVKHWLGRCFTVGFHTGSVLFVPQ